MARGISVTRQELRELLASGPVQFVVADVGLPLQWIATSECFSFWKKEVKPHLASSRQTRLDEFPGGYCYFDSRWEGWEKAFPTVVLERHH